MTVELTYNNDNLVLIGGESAGGKTASLRNINNPEGVIYLNCEASKKTPFPAKFKQFTITDPLQIYEAFDHAETLSDVHTIVVDSLTFLMDMYESVYVLQSTNTIKAWGDYAQFFKNLMQQYVAKSSKNVIFTAHVLSTLNEVQMQMETKVPIKGSLKSTGLEAFFSTIVYAKKMSVIKLKDYKSDLLNISPEEEALGIKYVFQTRLTKETVHERIRSSMGMWSINETYIDNDAQLLMDRLHDYYV